MSHSSGEDGRHFPLSPALRQALMSADAKHRASLEVLRTAICEYVEDLQDQGMHVRDVATAIRRRIGELRSSSAANPDTIKLDGVVDEMVAACLDGGE